MKLLVFAHTPPPHHGQSFMVAAMLDGFRKGTDNNTQPTISSEITCYHVNARLSDDIKDIGRPRLGKALVLLGYALQAIAFRFWFGVQDFYYIPAPGKRIALYRDWAVMALCRPFFPRLVFHWHAVGLGDWLTTEARPWERLITKRLLGFPDLSLTLAKSLSKDAAYFQSKCIRVVPNGIEDPCPDFEQSILPHRLTSLARRRERLAKNSEAAEICQYRVLFLAHCTHEKGLFDALQAIAKANYTLKELLLRLRMHLTVAGAFICEKDRREFDTWKQRYPNDVDYVSFVDSRDKADLLRKSDCLCFPTYYPAEGQPVSIIEAMAFGLNVVASNWRGIPDLLPENYRFLISPRDPAMLSSLLIESMTADLASELRERFRRAFTNECYVRELASALQGVVGPCHTK